MASILSSCCGSTTNNLDLTRAGRSYTLFYGVVVPEVTGTLGHIGVTAYDCLNTLLQPIGPYYVYERLFTAPKQHYLARVK